jgi:predicted metal-dependent peptidase
MNEKNEIPLELALNVLLFAVAIIDIANVAGLSVMTSSYTDDITIFYGSNCLNTLECQLQVVINQISQWAL